MATPKTVQRQLEQAEALQAQLIEATPDVEVVTDASQLVQPPPAAPPAPAQAPAPAATPPADTVDWKARYQSLQGMYNAEVPQLRAQSKVQESQVAALTEQVRALTAAVTTKPDPEPAKPKVDPRDVEAFGEPMMDMVNRYVSGVVTSLQAQVTGALSGLDQRVKALEGSVQGVTQRTEQSLEAQFWTTLSATVPDYEAVDASDGWKTWLAQTDRLTGRQRQELLNFAQKSLDAARVAEFFNAYKATIPPPPSAALNSQVSPSSGGAAEAPAANRPAQVITQQFIQDFYRELTKGSRGKYHGREAEVAQIEAAINTAAAEGRIR